MSTVPILRLRPGAVLIAAGILACPAQVQAVPAQVQAVPARVQAAPAQVQAGQGSAQTVPGHALAATAYAQASRARAVTADNQVTRAQAAAADNQVTRARAVTADNQATRAQPAAAYDQAIRAQAAAAYVRATRARAATADNQATHSQPAAAAEAEFAPGPKRAAPSWPQPGYSPADTYYNPGESSINAASINAVRRRWTVALPEAGERCARAAEPLLADGLLFVPQETGISAFQAGTGRLSWRFTWPYPEDESTPHLALSGGLLIVANSGCQSQSDPNGTVRALSVTSGRLVWSAALQAPVESLVVERGVVVVSGESASDSPAVVGLAVADGTQLWQLADHSSAGVSAAGRVLVSRVGAAGTSALSITTGEPLWTRPLAWTGRAATPTGDRFYVSDRRNAMICVSAATGAVVWTAARRGSSLVAADGRRVYRAIAKRVEALDARTGRFRWTAPLAGYAGQPVRAGGLLYTTVDGGRPLGILHAATGRPASAGTQVGSVAGGHVVVTGGWIYAVKGNTVSGYAR
ncbi:PQQ-binding-like beta-propeller repeat protein [Actinoplanes sp. NPDC049599]|uniref:PQQ-binding-like beta-propeller repeat protein n=1 Tax=Actinoplanes sp. NPDC049599 TaxID=3363903 RepID=UPI0037972B96